MVADAMAAVRALADVEHVSVSLDDHFASGEINAAIAADGGFEAAFPGQSGGGLGDLRNVFTRKAFVARQGAMCDRLLHAGRTVEELAGLRLGALSGDPQLARCLELRSELGIGITADAPAFVRADGTALEAGELTRFLRVARLVGLSIEGNAGLCRSLLATRYGIGDPEEAAAA